MLSDRQYVKLQIIKGLLNVMSDKGKDYLDIEWLSQASEKILPLILPESDSLQMPSSPEEEKYDLIMFQLLSRI